MRRLAASTVFVAALIAAACASSRKPVSASDPPAKSAPDVETNDVGEVLANGLLGLVSVDDEHLATRGEVTFVVRGLADGDVPIEAYVLFTWSSGDPAPIEVDELPQSDPVKASEERIFQARAPSWDARHGAGLRLVGAQLFVMSGEFVPLVARIPEGAGSRFLGGAVECVGLEYDAQDLVKSIELENVSPAAVTGAEARVYFVDVLGEKQVGTTRWVPVPEIAPGARVLVPVDLARGKASHDYGLYMRSRAAQAR